MIVIDWIRRNIENIKVILMLPVFPVLYLGYRIKSAFIKLPLTFMYSLALGLLACIHPIFYLLIGWFLIGVLVLLNEWRK